jgi:phage baseplate assembly protein W
MAINNHIYSDLDLTFKPIPATGDVALKYDEQSVIASIRNLLNTGLYDRLFQPDIGSSLNQLLFEPCTPLTATLIQNEVIRTITNYEPRVTINTLNVTAAPDSNQFNISLSVLVGNQTQPTAFNIILQRTR